MVLEIDKSKNGVSSPASENFINNRSGIFNLRNFRELEFIRGNSVQYSIQIVAYEVLQIWQLFPA